MNVLRNFAGAIVLSLVLPAAPVWAQGTYQTYVVDPVAHTIAIHWKDDTGSRFSSIRKLKAWLEAKHETLLFATNGGIFETDYSPLGLYIEDGKVRHPLNTGQGAGNFYFQPNAVFYIDNNGGHVVKTADFKYSDAIVTATQSGPMLVDDGEINEAFKPGSPNLLVRTGVGIDDAGKVVFAKGSGVNLYEFAQYFRDTLHCRNAMFLDGTISLMYTPQADKSQLGGDFATIISVSEPQTSSPAQNVQTK